MTSLVAVEGDGVAARLAPELGGRIVSLVDRATGREALWSSGEHAHTAHPPGTGFDAVFAGGWEELVPNDAPERRGGRDLPDHGELWTTPLEVIAQDAGAVELRGTLPLTGLQVGKRVAAGDELAVTLTLHNPGPEPVELELKLHPALRISTGARIELPAVRARVFDPAFSRAAGDFAWPVARDAAGAELRADVVPPPGDGAEALHLVPGPAGGRCALVHDEEGWSVELTYDPAALGELWVFGDFGGWQGTRFLLLEPATGPLTLAPHQTFETTVRCRLGKAPA